MTMRPPRIEPAMTSLFGPGLGGAGLGRRRHVRARWLRQVHVGTLHRLKPRRTAFNLRRTRAGYPTEFGNPTDRQVKRGGPPVTPYVRQ